MVSVESKDFMMAKKAKELAQDDPFFEEFSKMEYHRYRKIVGEVTSYSVNSE